MTKLKTRRSAAKRFSFTGTGKIKRRRAGHRHNMTAQPKKAKTLARKSAIVRPGDSVLVRVMMPYGG
ncbi:MAG: 50S ribosomal protein L35 [Geminicoccaceae bacterium]|nr:50S ribosomal protein L35 [Geminicoccaceae bacterium]